MPLLDENSTDENTQLRTGHIVGDSQRTVILCHQICERVPGDSFATWIAIAHKSEEFHPYVVWNVIARPTGFHAESGNYCSTIKEAVAFYESRGGR